MEPFFVVVLVVAILSVGVLALVVLRRTKRQMDPADPQER